jgi:hypothetical protein
MLTLEVTEVTAANVELLAVGRVWEVPRLQAVERARLVCACAGLGRRWLRGARGFAAAHVRVYVRAADVGEGRQTTFPHVGAYYQPVAALTVWARRFAGALFSGAGPPAPSWRS